MKFRIPKSRLLEQLPHKVGYDLIQGMDEMPEYFEFEGELVPDEKVADALSQKYPLVFKVFSLLEWKFFCELERRPLGTPRSALRVYLHAPSFSKSNAIDVHIKNIRAKLRKNDLPFYIETQRVMLGDEGYFTLKHGTPPKS